MYYLYNIMSEVAGFWETELEKVVQKLIATGGAVRVTDHEGKKVIVKVESIDPARIDFETGWA